MKGLLIAEHNQQQLKAATLHTLSAVRQLANDITVLVMGHGSQAVANEASHLVGVNKVVWVESAAFEHPLAEDLACQVLALAPGFDYIVAPATTMGKNFMPRVAAMLDVAQISDIIAITAADTFMRPMYAGNAVATVQSLDAIKVITVRTTAFEKAPLAAKAVATVEQLAPVLGAKRIRFVKHVASESMRPELSSARIVVSGGRGLQSIENFKLIEVLADKLGAALGATRAAVDAGWVPNDYQVGQTGKMVAPELYIAVGISGAVQHIAGIKDSKVIVAINQDADAPIFQVADYGLVGDLFQIIPALIAALEQYSAV